MTHKALIRRLQISCLGLDPIDPLRLLVDDVVEALAQPPQPEPVKITHKHEWFRTGEMKVGQMRCISCGTWGQEEMPQRTWVGLTDEEIKPCWHEACQTELELTSQLVVYFAKAIEAKLKEKNT